MNKEIRRERRKKESGMKRETKNNREMRLQEETLARGEKRREEMVERYKFSTTLTDRRTPTTP